MVCCGSCAFSPRNGWIPMLCLLTAAACADGVHRGDAGLQLRLELEPARPEVGTVRVAVQVSDADWRPRNGARVTVSATHAQAQSVDWVAPGQGAGHHVAEALPLGSPGEWLLTVRAELSDGRWTERDWVVTVAPDSL